MGSTVISFLISTTTLALPLTYNLTHSFEMKTLVTVTAVTMFIQVHLLVVIFIQFKMTVGRSSDQSEEAEVEGSPTVLQGPPPRPEAQK